MNDKINQRSDDMNVIIVGCGRVGRALVETLTAEGHKIAIVDRLPAAFTKINPNLDVEMIVGTGIDFHILELAGINTADAVISVAKGDNTNIMVAQIAKQIFKVPNVVAKIVDPRTKEFYEKEMGLKCYCQTETSAMSYISMVKGSDSVCISL